MQTNVSTDATLGFQRTDYRLYSFTPSLLYSFYLIQLTTPSEPAMAVSTAINTLSNFAQSIGVFEVIGLFFVFLFFLFVGADRCVCPVVVCGLRFGGGLQGEHIGSPLLIADYLFHADAADLRRNHASFYSRVPSGW